MIKTDPEPSWSLTESGRELTVTIGDVTYNLVPFFIIFLLIYLLRIAFLFGVDEEYSDAESYGKGDEVVQFLNNDWQFNLDQENSYGEQESSWSDQSASKLQLFDDTFSLSDVKRSHLFEYKDFHMDGISPYVPLGYSRQQNQIQYYSDPSL